MERPSLQQLLAAVEAGHVAHVLIWRLDRLSRNLGDLILLADQLGAAGIGLHSFTEQLDLSSATGRMFYNVLGSFAQFYREQLAENVKMGTQQAVRQGKWVNRPKTGYDLVDGELVPNDMAPVVQHVFRLRAEGKSYSAIEASTGVKYSTARAIVLSRIYLGEVLLNGVWYPGHHEEIITVEEFTAAQRAHSPGRRRSQDVLSGRVRCGLCDRAATVHYNRKGQVTYRCHHRGRGCSQPIRSARGLLRAALLGLGIIAEDKDVREAIRRNLGRAQGPVPQGRARGPVGTAARLAELASKRRKLLELYYADRITAGFFAEEEAGLAAAIEAMRDEQGINQEKSQTLSELSARFEAVAEILRNIDLDTFWAEATERERRVLVEELVESVVIFPDHLEVTIAGAPRLNVALAEVGLKEPGVSNDGVGEGT